MCPRGWGCGRLPKRGPLIWEVAWEVDQISLGHAAFKRKGWNLGALSTPRAFPRALAPVELFPERAQPLRWGLGAETRVMLGLIQQVLALWLPAVHRQPASLHPPRAHLYSHGSDIPLPVITHPTCSCV